MSLGALILRIFARVFVRNMSYFMEHLNVSEIIRIILQGGSSLFLCKLYFVDIFCSFPPQLQ